MKSGISRMAAVALVGLALSASAGAATHEIGPGGDWAAVVAGASAGDTIEVRLNAPAPVDVLISKQLTITNHPGESPVLDGAGAAYSAFRFDANGSGSVISGLAFQNYTGYALRTASGSPAITVSSCVFDNCGWTFGLKVTAGGSEVRNAAKGGYAIHGSSFTGCTFTNLSPHGMAYSDNLSFTACVFNDVDYVVVRGDGLTLTDVTVDAAVAITNGTNNVAATNVTARNVSYIAFCGGTNVSVSDSTFENVVRGAYDVSGLTFADVTQTGTGSYLVGWCDNVTLENVTAENLRYFAGGGDNVVIRNCTIRNMAAYGIVNCNNVTSENVTLDGGSMAYAGCTGAHVTRNIIVNHRTGPGEAFYTTYGTVTNSTIVGNKIARAWITAGSLDFDSCIVTDNDRFGWGGGTAQYCLMQTGCEIMGLGEGNLIGFLPRFVNPAGGDYGLRANSPAIDAGNPALPVPPEGGARVDIGAVEYDGVADAATPPTISILTPAASDVSPAFVEGTVSADTTSVTWQTATDSGTAVLTTAGKFWLNAPLSATDTTMLTVTASDGTNDTPAVQEITWNVTDILSCDSVIKIRKGDALLFTGNGAADELEIDADGDGILELDGALPGDLLPYQYTVAGDYNVTARLKDEFGQEITSRTIYVTVIDVNLHGPCVACRVGYRRDIDVFVSPAGAKESVAYTSADGELLYVGLKEHTADGAIIQLEPHYRGTPVYE
ncbi:MAG TPA: hypothetical protein ENN09_03440, partial [Planctomycetes bacterium]|nr:hypothetical protein [Planctomycetota bacterium]